MNDRKLFKIFFILIISTSILIPICVNWGLMLGDFIPSSGSNGEWLSFYGSYFGGTIGGIATLGAVFFAIKSTRDNARPLIMPVSTNLFGYIFKDGSIKILDEHKEDFDIFDTMSTFITNHISAVNAGLETALNIKIIWDKAENKIFLDLLRDLGYTEADFDELHNCMKLKGTTEMNKDYLISIKNGANNSTVEIPREFTSLLKFLLRQEQKNRNGDINTAVLNNHLVNKEYILTTVLIEYEDIYGNPYSEKYNIFFRVQDIAFFNGQFEEKVINLTMKKI
ncbi:MAG: hypothetical protein E7206_04740 [Clostridium beijerinckii]|nr:hypothetical protein [Clostridium beijerinckii]